MENAFNYSHEHLKIVVNGNEVDKKGYDLIEFKLNFEVNHHTKLILKVKIKETNTNEWDFYTRQSGGTSTPGERELSFFLNDRKYFTGIIQRGSTKVRDDGDLVAEMEVYSKSEIMDRDKNYRVYQNPKIRYIDIVKDILGRHEYMTILGVSRELYSEDSGLHERLSTPMKSNLIIQFDETDWEFLVRILSHIGLGIFNTENGSISLGLSADTTESKKWNIVTGNIGRGIDKYDNIYYELESQDFFLMGDNVIHNGKQDMGYVNEGEVVCIEGKFYGKYLLKNFEYWFDYIPNRKIKGAKIDGKVINVPLISNKEGVAIILVNFTSGIEKLIGNKEKNRQRESRNPVKLNGFNDWITYKEGEGYFSFPYATFYSQTNTGFFCTPEINDVIPMIFESDEECECYGGFAVDNPKSGRFSDPYYRNYTTHPEGGSEDCCFEFSVSRDNYIVECKNIYKEIFKDKYVEANNSINIDCDNTISIENKNSMTMKTETCGFNISSEYNETVGGTKNFSSITLNEQVSGTKAINSQVYDLTTGVYKTNK